MIWAGAAGPKTAKKKQSVTKGPTDVRTDGRTDGRADRQSGLYHATKNGTPYQGSRDGKDNLE